MSNVELKSLVALLNPLCKSNLESAVMLCANRQHYDVTVEHYLLSLLDEANGDVVHILKHFEVEPTRLRKRLQRHLETLQNGNVGRPVFSPFLLRWIEASWMVASVNHQNGEIRSGMMLTALIENSGRFCGGDYSDLFEDINAVTLHHNFDDIVRQSGEHAAGLYEGVGSVPSGDTSGLPGADAGGGGTALQLYAMNFTQRAREGSIDPVFGRDREIRQMIDILGRRRKNNPIVVGEAGVGKTALAEGLAVRIVEGDVPDLLKNVEIISLDLGLLQAGAGVKGEFENRLKDVIAEVKASPTPLILFIDEAHTMIGAGGAEGGSDAANLLKPALARGELRTIAATTWSEYKKYFEKDAALSRRFQLVKVEEPSIENTCVMLRGLRSRYEEALGVIIRDDAIVAAAELGSRYIAGRQHPDKGIDLIDTAAARVSIALTARPADLQDVERSVETMERELNALRQDEINCAVPLGERADELVELIEQAKVRAKELREEWLLEKAQADKVLEVRERFAELRKQYAQYDEETENPEEHPQVEGTRVELRAELEKLHEMQGKDPLVNVEVTPEVIGRVVSDWTGVPMGKMVRDEAVALLGLEAELGKRIKGQPQVLEEVARTVRAAKAGVKNPNTPMGVFLFVGPSGVGKTETGLGVADLLFGGDRFLTTINMSEFQEKHTVSRLIGSPPGYVGYGEGGVLTEAVRQKPYSVVLLDEVEKAHPEVLNLFYQVFDKGTLSDGEGRVINFKDTVIFLTSNLATDIITKRCAKKKLPDTESLIASIRPVLSDHFKPALLARMTIVPFYTIRPEVMREITELKLGHLADRLAGNHRMQFAWSDEVVDLIASRCHEVETGARNVDHIINSTMLPAISSAILVEMAAGGVPGRLTVGVDGEGGYTYTFSEKIRKEVEAVEAAEAVEEDSDAAATVEG